MKKTLILSIFLASIIISAVPRQASCFQLTKELKSEIDDKQWLVKVHPNDPQYHFDLAITYAYSNRIEDGLAELKKVKELDESYAPKAMAYYSKKTGLFPDDWKLRFRYAFALYFNDEKKEAIAEFQKIIQQDPKNVFSYGYIAVIYGEMGNVDDAIEYAQKALDIDSNIAAIHLLLATAYYKKGRPGPGFQETFEALRLRALGY